MSVYNSAGTGVAVVTLNGFTNGWMSSALAFGNTASGLVAGQGTEMYSMTGGAINIDARL
jgi:hypothetical protein